MIFVTVGTHEQQFDRLVTYMDKWAAEHDEEVIIQTGYSTVEPVNCKWQKFFLKSEMNDFISSARIVITHGGPSCYIDVLDHGKIPVVVPRRHQFGEHVDDHQYEIGLRLKEFRNNIIFIEDIEKLGQAIADYDELIKGMNNSTPHMLNEAFCDEFSKRIDRLFE